VIQQKEEKSGNFAVPWNFRALDIAILLGACALAVAHAVHFSHTADDAYIAFRYVDNWSRGNGLVFNVGERVMGYSSLLWVVLLYALERFDLDAPSGARLLGTLLAWATLARVYIYLKRQHLSRGPAVAGLAVLVSSGTFGLWMFGGLEAHLLAFLLLSGTIEALEIKHDAPLSRYIRLGILFGLCSLTRPEALLYIAPVGLWLWLRQRDRSRALGVAIFWAIAASFSVGLALWAWSYYGDPLPNTYYAKAHPLSIELLQRGWFLMRKFVLDYYGAPMLAIALWAIVTRGSPSARGWLPLGVIATFAVFFLRIGGDALVYHRMWLPMLPLLGLLVGEAVARIRHVAVAGGATVVLAALTFPNSVVGPNIKNLRVDDAFLSGVHLVAARLRDFPPTTVVAANNVGILGYDSRLPVVDMLGLNDARIARAPGKRVGIPGHESHDGGYVLDRNPHLIFVGLPWVVSERNPEEDVYRGWYPSDRDLFDDSRFLRDYKFRYLDLADGLFAPVFSRVAKPAER
jgi:hypothetical protein